MSTIMRKQFFALAFVLNFLILAVGWNNPAVLWAFTVLGPITLIGLHNSFQTKKAILRNFPILGIFRYLFEMIRPEIQQYFVESDMSGTPFPRELRSLVYQRPKTQTDTLPIGTHRNVYETGYEWISHSLAPRHIEAKDLRVTVGGPQCKRPYSASVFNISAMSYGALSSNAVLSLNGGAKLGNFYHNTGEGGLSPHHLAGGGDLVWQIGTGYFGCRDLRGNFSPELFKSAAAHENVKMIEIKLSQGAKPSHGGILPAAKITKEIMAIRKVGAGKDVVSPPAHSAFSTPKGLLKFVQLLRELSNGKPVGFKLCIGHHYQFIAICKAMLESNIFPDFITVDGGEGGTGAAPLEFSNSVGSPLEEGLSFVHDTLVGFNIRQHIRIIASGKVLNGFNIFSKMALGADICNSARGMMLALGCIQARQCNTNKCPTGIATSDRSLVQGLVPEDKKVRVFNFHRQTVQAFAELVGATGLTQTKDISRGHITRRISGSEVKTYQDLFPTYDRGFLLAHLVPEKFAEALALATADSFLPMQKTAKKEFREAA